MTVIYRRAAGATSRRVGAALFLANAARGTLYRVSSSVAAVWNLLSRPATAEEAIEVFQTAFPALPRAKLRADVQMMLRDLESEGVIERVTTRPAEAKRRARKKRPRG